MEESVKENLTCVLIKSNVRSMQWNIYRSLMCFGNKCCELMKLIENSFATISKGMFGEKRTPCQLLSVGVDPSCFGVVLQPAAQETSYGQREEWIL